MGEKKKITDNSIFYAESTTPNIVLANANDAFVKIKTNYENNGTVLLKNSSLHGTAGNRSNPLATNPLEAIRTDEGEAISVELPYSGVNARIRFDGNLNLSEDTGTYLVCIDYNGNGIFDDQEYRVDYSATYTEPF